MRRSAAVLFSVFVFSLGAGQASAAGWDGQNAGERNHRRADALRERAGQRAGENLGYDPIHQYPANRGNDSYSLTVQISQLAQVIRNLADSYAAVQSRSIPLASDAQGVPVPLAGPLAGGNVRAIYGPGGPTARSVGIILDYQLLVGGNPSLKKGRVEETATTVSAEVVTADGTVVRRYVIDRKTGLWATTGE